jgi:cyclin-dependent kinase-like
MQELFAKNPTFIGFKFPDIGSPETLEKRYVGKLSKKAINLMGRMLELNPKDRITALEALGDPFFDGIRETEIDDHILKSQQQKLDRASSKSRGAHSRQRRSTKAEGSPKVREKSKNKKVPKVTDQNTM